MQREKLEISETSTRMLLLVVLSCIALAAAQKSDTLKNVEKAEEKLKELARPSTLNLK